MSESSKERSDPPDGRDPDATGDSAISRYLVLAHLVIALLVVGVGGWAVLASISGAVIAPGTVTVESNSKSVQHLDGGIIDEIRVRDGDMVAASDLLIRLDATVPRANLAIVTKQLDELQARQGRLEAEREPRDVIRYSKALQDRRSDPHVRKVMVGQAKLFRARAEALEGQRAQLRERVGQLRDEISGLEAQRRAKSSEIKMIEDELAGLRELRAKGLVPKTRLVKLRREATRLEGERGRLIAEKARAAGRVGETEIQIIQLGRERMAEVVTELRDVQLKVASLSERRVAAEDQLRRVEIRAPIGGHVHDLAFHTIGGVVPGGKEILKIVPDKDALIVEARLEPKDVDQVRMGQAATIRLSGFNQRTTPEVSGTVSHVSADLVRNEKNEQPFFKVRLRFDENALERLDGKQLLPGMPAEAFIQTDRRTALSYLVKPFTDQLQRAFREE